MKIGTIATIDNMCMCAYESATEYLFQEGLIDKTNDRMYKMKEKAR